MAEFDTVEDEVATHDKKDIHGQTAKAHLVVRRPNQRIGIAR